MAVKIEINKRIIRIKEKYLFYVYCNSKILTIDIYCIGRDDFSEGVLMVGYIWEDDK